VERLAFSLLNESHLPVVLALERAGYPADEAASEANLRLRLRSAGHLFLGAFLPADQEDMHPDPDPVASPSTLVGFVCSTQTHSETLTHQAMSEHIDGGPTVCIHSVCVHTSYRRQGVALALLREYAKLLDRETESRHYARMALISKEYLVPLYTRAGFRLLGPSSVVHGKDQWYEMQLPLPLSSSESD